MPRIETVAPADRAGALPPIRTARLRPGRPASGPAAQAFAAALESTGGDLILVDSGWRVAFVNRRAQECFGEGTASLVGRPLWDFWPRRESAPSRQMLVRALEQQSPRRFEDYFPGLDAWFEIEAHPWLGGLALHLRDVTERRYAARDLAAREARYRAIIDSAQDAIVVYDGDGIVREVNPAGEAMFGYLAHDLVGRHIAILGAGDWGSEASGRRIAARRGDGTTLPLEISVAEWRCDGRCFLTAIGREAGGPAAAVPAEDPAAGIAHDFNNLLLVMGTQLELALDRLPADSSAREPHATVRAAIGRAGGLVPRLLEFAAAGE